MSHVPLLLTRPEAASRRFAGAVSGRLGAGQVIISPVLRIVPVGPVPPLSAYGGVILTSENAVTQATHDWPAGLPAYCVGSRTADAASAVGLDARSADGSLPDLLAMIQAARLPRRLLYLRGRHVTGDVAETLSTLGIPTDEAVVYDQIACPLSEEAVTLLAQPGPVLIPVFSTRSARALAPMLEKTAASLLIAAISPAVASALPVHSAEMMAVALRPDAEAVLDRIAQLQSGLRA